MNIQEYISTGILEAYALGEATEAERLNVEQELAQHPELRQELQKVEETLEKIAFASAISPAATLKARIMTRMSEDASGAKEISMVAERPIWRYAAAASVALALLTSSLAYYYRQQWQETATALTEIVSQNRQMAEEYNVVNQKLDKIQGDLAVIENNAFTKVLMKGTANDKSALASIYWNPSTQEVYLSIQQLKTISKENQFQLWAIVNGKPVDAGVFDLNFAGLLKMKSINGAAAFAVTIEPRGGKASPTLETMQVLGTVPNPS